MKKFWIWSGVLATLTIFFLFYFLLKQPEPSQVKASKINYKIIPGKYPGWGFIIYVDGKQYIRQDIIPAVQGNASFKKKRQAKAVAKLMISKMSTETLPTITVEELDSLGALK